MLEHKFLSAHIGGLRLAIDDTRLHQHPGLDREVSAYISQGWKLHKTLIVPRDDRGFWLVLHLTREAETAGK